MLETREPWKGAGMWTLEAWHQRRERNLEGQSSRRDSVHSKGWENERLGHHDEGRGGEHWMSEPVRGAGMEGGLRRAIAEARLHDGSRAGPGGELGKAAKSRPYNQLIRAATGWPGLLPLLLSHLPFD